MISEIQGSSMVHKPPVKGKQKDPWLQDKGVHTSHDSPGSYTVNQDSKSLSKFVLTTELPDYFLDSSEDDNDIGITPLTPATPYDYFEENQKDIEDCINEDAVSYETYASTSDAACETASEAMTSLAGLVSPALIHPIQSQKQIKDPIERVKHDIQALQGSDQVFMMSLGFVQSKLLIAMDDPHSVYLFRDFAGTFTEFLDRFGPGAYDCQRAPKSISWMIKLMLPWLQMNHSEFNVQFSIYCEVSGWAQNMIKLLGANHSTVILEEGLWDVCCDQMAHSSPNISKIAYQTAKQIIASVPLNKHIIYKILLMRNGTLGYDDIEMFMFRHHRSRLINSILEKIDNTLYPANLCEYQAMVREIEADLEYSVSIETEKNVRQCTSEVLDYAKELLQSFQALEANSPPEMMAATFKDHKLRPSSRIILNKALPIDCYLNRDTALSNLTVASFGTTYTIPTSTVATTAPKRLRHHRFWDRIVNKFHRMFHKYGQTTDGVAPNTVFPQFNTSDPTRDHDSLRPFDHKQDLTIPHANEIETYFMNTDM